MPRRLTREIYYPIPPHLQEAYQGLNYPEGSFPISERIHREVVSLPMGPHLTREQVKMVTDAAISYAGAGIF